MVRKKGTETELRWRDIVHRQAGSGLSIRKFCAKEGISQPSFYAWRRKLGKQDGNGTRARKSKRRVDELGGGAFIPLKLDTSIEVFRISFNITFASLKRLGLPSPDRAGNKYR